MNLLIIGCLSFVLFCIYDFLKLGFLTKYGKVLFVAGILLLAGSTLGILVGDSHRVEIPIFMQLIWGGLALVSLLLLFFSLFFCVPFYDTYIKAAKTNTVVDTGMYALCRHPGVLWFGLFYLFLWLASGKNMILWAGILWTLMDIALVYVEDRWIFPKLLNGYEQYKRNVPFIIPDKGSIKTCIISFHRSFFYEQ